LNNIVVMDGNKLVERVVDDVIDDVISKSVDKLFDKAFDGMNQQQQQPQQIPIVYIDGQQPYVQQPYVQPQPPYYNSQQSMYNQQQAQGPVYSFQPQPQPQPEVIFSQSQPQPQPQPRPQPQPPLQTPPTTRRPFYKKYHVMMACLSIFFAFIALVDDELSTDTSNGCTGTCHWDLNDGTCDGVYYSGSFSISYSSCASSNSNCSKYESAGNAWLGFGIIGLLIGLIPIFAHIFCSSSPWLLRYHKYIYLTCAICLFISFVSWAANGCQTVDSSYSIGASPILMIFASIFMFISCGLDWCYKI